MGQVLTNNTGLAYARESSLGVLPGSPDWKELEPNSIGSFGASITTTERNPISKNRQRRKGTVTDLDAEANYDGDLTVDSFVDFVEAFLFATAVNADLTFRGADINASGVVIPSATAAQAAKIQFTSGGPITLLHFAGYATSTTNTPQSYRPITVDVASTNTVIEYASSVVETAPSNAEVSVCGIRAKAGDIAIAVSSGVATITSGNNTASNNIDFTTLGLTVGQRVHIGGIAAANRPVGAGSAASFGSGRVLSLAAGTMTLDKIDATLIASDGTDDNAGGVDIPTDILFGRFVRNVPVDDSAYNRISHHFEGAFENLFETDPPTPVANPNGYEYVVGAIANEMTWNMALTDKATATFGFIATNAEDPVNDASRKSGASTAREPLFTGALNTSADFFRLRIEDVDETGLTTDFSDLALTFNNGVTPEKVLGLLGARFMNVGNFLVNLAGTALFTNANVPARIRGNVTVSADFLVKNDDGAIAVDIPSGTLSSDGKEYPVNESVKISLDLSAFQDPTFGTSVGVSLFPVFPVS